MEKIILFTIVLMVSGCAKFRFQQNSFFIPSVVLQVQSPMGGTVFDPGTTFTITGICDPLGGLVTIVGTSMVEASVSGACDPVLGVFSINATSVGNGELLDIRATQTDVEGTVLNSDVTNIMIHCAGVPMRTCRVSGSGNPSDPYMVGDISCLQEMRTGLSCHYALNNNIDASATSGWNFNGSEFRGWEPVPNDSNPSVRFTGVLDGRNRSISNLYITPRNGNGSGFFSRLDDEGNGLIDDQVYNLTFVNPTANFFDIFMNYPYGFGVLAGATYTVGIRNVDVVGGDIDLTTDNTLNSIGILAGYTFNSNLSNSDVSGNITFNGLIDGSDTKYDMVGGFVGLLENSQVVDSSSNMTYVTAPANLYYFYSVGGAFGRIASSVVSRFRSTANLTLGYYGTTIYSGFDKVGGFAGYINFGSRANDICVNNNINISSFNSKVSDTGGFAGYAGSFSNQFFDRISTRGSFSVDANGNDLSTVSGYVGSVLGTSIHSDILIDLDIDILNGVSPDPYHGYGGIVNMNGTNNSFTNVIGISSHNISAGINTPGGLFYNINGSSLTSVFYANDASLGGLPEEGTLGSPGLVTTSTLAGLGALASSSYVGFDFSTIWQRDPITNIPELRFCP